MLKTSTANSLSFLQIFDAGVHGRKSGKYIPALAAILPSILHLNKRIRKINIYLTVVLSGGALL